MAKKLPALPVLTVTILEASMPTHSIRVSDEEWAAWTAHADANKMSVSEWVRATCAYETRRVAVVNQSRARRGAK